jgi:hypothetical protein
MSGNDDALRGLIDEMVLVLAPLVEAAQAPGDFTRLLADLGWSVPSIPAPLRDLATAGANLINGLSAGPGEIPTQQVLADITRLVGAIDAIRTKPDSAFPTGIDIASFKQTIGRDLLDYCVVDHALRRRFKVGRLLQLAGIIRLIDTPALGLRQAYLKRHVAWGRIGILLTDPVSGFREAYAWNAATTQLKPLLGDIAAVFEAFGLNLSFFTLTAKQLAFANTGALQPLAADVGITLDLNEALGVPFDSEAGVQLIMRAATAARGPAIAFMPYAQLNASTSTADDDIVSVSIKGDADLTRGLAITLAPGKSPLLESGFLSGQPVTSAATNFQVDLRIPSQADQPERILLGTAEGSRVSVHTVTVSAGAALLPERQVDVFAAVDFQDALAAIKPGPGETDSFLAELLGPDGISAKFSFGLRLSSVTGFHLTGSGGLTARFPASVQLGPAGVQAVTLELATSDQGAELRVGAAVVGSIGPVSLVTDGLGFALTARFPDPPTGNLGPIDLSTGFTPPFAIGVSVDAQGVLSGGGTLFHNNHLYAGVMQLSLHDRLTLTAFGLIATQPPGGGSGYSMLIFITAEDFQPVPLGLGFTLHGIGGMVAVNRTFDETVLRAAMRNDTLGSLLFPRDPVANAPAIISALASAFPARSGSYLMGILARIGWGTPTLIWFDLALILEFGTRQRLLALGRISALLPSPDNDLLRLNLDAIGVLDLDQGSLAIDAVLVDSRLVHKFALTGAGALRVGGSGAGSGFVLAVGGFNPRFAPPAGVPSLPRVAIALSSGNNPRLTCEAYFALTSNTVQFGARAQLHAEAYGFSVDGDVGFDVLISRAPLHFIADFHASAQLKHGSHNLFKVSLEGSLEGPRPLRASGKASFEIFWCDFTVRFDKTLIDGDPPPLPPAVDVQGELLRALGNAQSWRTDVVASRTHGVALRKLTPGATLVIDPLGRLVVTQDVVPLNAGRDIDIFGGAPVAGARRFTLSASLNGVTLRPPQTLRAAFAPAQFFEMSDDEKLASPSFEMMDAGMAVGSDAVTFDAARLVAASLEYESIVLDTLAPPGDPPPPSRVRYKLAVSQLRVHSATGAAARAPVRRGGRARFRTAGPPAVRLSEPRWAIVPIDTAPEVPVDPTVRTWSEHLAALHTLNRGGARYQLVPARQPS